MTDNFDLFESRARRDEGMDCVEEPTFSEAVSGVVCDMDAGIQVTGEDIRRLCTSRGVTPHHPNAWGGVISGLVCAGRLRATGEYRQMADVKSHARETKVYRVPSEWESFLFKEL